MRFIFLVLFGFLIITSFAGNNDIDKTKQAKEWLKNQPLAFIENKGQFTNSDGKPADNVLFKATYGNCDIYITTEGISYVFHKYETTPAKSIDANTFRRMPGEKTVENKSVSYYRMDMNLQGSAINKTQILKELPGKQGVTNYFYPHCPEGIYGMQEYGKITIRNIYRGIDWVIYTNAGNKEAPLKYDFLVQPQANYKDIKIKFVNAQSTSVTDEGTKLKIQTIAGNIEEGNLYSYLQNSTEKQAIKTNYIANSDSTLQFELGAYDKTKILVIDPLVWATYYGGSGDDKIYSICTDSKDNFYISGNTGSSDYPSLHKNDAYWQATKNGNTDAFFVKFDKHGMRQWATFYGGSENDESSSIYADKLGIIILTGMTKSPDFPTQPLPGAYNQSIIGGYEDAFILKFNSQGQRQWATFYGGDNADAGYDISEDSQKNIYVTGRAISFDFPIEPLEGAYNQPKKSDSYDGFILKFDLNGKRKWATYYGGNSADDFYHLVIDTQDNVYFTGRTMSTDFPTQTLSGAYWQNTKNTIFGSRGDVFILKIDKQGKTLWSTYYGGNDEDWGNSLCLDSDTNIYITGWSASYDFRTLRVPGAFYQPYGEGGGSFLLKFTGQGKIKWATFFGARSDNLGANIICDKKKNIYITGYAGPHFRVQKQDGEYWQPTCNNSGDAYIIKFDSLGIIKWSTYYGGTAVDYGIDLAADSKNSIYMAGIYKQDAYTLDYGSGAYYDSTGDGSDDGFIIKITNCINQKPASVQSDRNNICIHETGFVTLTTLGGEGDTLKWYSDKAGLNYLGKYTPFTVPVPSQTTTYYARWESLCDTSMCDSITIQIYKEFAINQSQKICPGETCIVGNSSYTQPGTYVDTLQTLSGCDSIVTTVLTVNPVERTEQNALICEGESFTFGAHSYIVSGRYHDTLSSVKYHCDSIITTNLTVVLPERTSQDQSICEGESYFFATHNYTATGAYKDTLSTIYGCDSIITTNLTVIPSIHIVQNASICEGETFSFGTNVYSAAGNYSDAYKTSIGCDSIVTTNLTVNPLPIVSLGDDQLLCPGDSITLSPGNGFIRYLWSDGSLLSNLIITGPGNYSVTAFNEWCPASDEITIIECGTEIWLPNAFSPDDDGVNDRFNPVILGTLNSFHIIIYNRWGQELYESNDALTGWDGKFEGSICTTGQYVYIATYSMGTELSTQKQRVKRGFVTLVR